MIYKVKMNDSTVRIVYSVGNDTIDNIISKWGEEQQTNVLGYEQIDLADLPASRNYRDAWGHDLTIDLNKAKEIHKKLIGKIANKRLPFDTFGNQDTSQVQSELSALQSQIDNAADLDELYNLWPASIETRQSPRSYPTQNG